MSCVSGAVRHATDRACLAPRGRGRQRGAVAIEFALTFVLFFGIFYAIVSYAFPLLLSQSMNMAVAEGARSALAMDPQTEDYDTRLQDHARERTRAYLEDSLMVALFPGEFVVATELVDDLLEVSVTYDYRADPLMVPLELPLIGQVPRIPEQLGAQASVELAARIW